MRWIAVAAPITVHLALMALADTLPDALPVTLMALVAATVYGPLLPLSALGATVFAAAEAGGWARPSAVGWLVPVIGWAAFWSVLVALLRRRP